MRCKYLFGIWAIGMAGACGDGNRAGLDRGATCVAGACQSICG